MKDLNKQTTKQNDRLTKHKRFVPYGTHPNFCFAKTSFMLGTLGKTATRKGDLDEYI